MKENNQVKWGAILSYILIVFNSLYGVLITPYMISSLGEIEYGVYKAISSFAAVLSIMDMGFGSTVMRYVAKYKASKKDHEIPNFLAMVIIQVSILASIIIAVSCCIYPSIRVIYATTFTEQQLHKAQLLFICLIANLVFTVFSNALNGVINGHNQFVFSNGVNLAKVVIRAMLIIVLLGIFDNSIVIVLINLALTLLFIGVDVVYIRKKLTLRIKLTRFDKMVFWESGKYSLLLFFSSIESQVNSNMDNVFIGSLCGPNYVTVYSVGLLIFGMFQSLSMGIAGVMLPTVTNLVENDSKDELFKLIILAGRIQFALMGAAIIGFACIGKELLHLWLGGGFDDVYVITMILICATILELCVNTCLSVLRARNQIGFHIGAKFAGTIVNVVATYFAVKYWSYIGAAVCTAVTFFIAQVVVMGVYYTKKIGIPILRIYAGIFNRIWICLLIAGCGLWVFAKYFHGSIWTFVASIAVFCSIYGIMMLTYGLSEEEKRMLRIGGKNND